ncbi:murein biosynthesis integral membrane protein MurJ [Parafrigoribacterium soli]|uniref:murein biosynthesis integral membrane protein MurJ n=1 Tax=Parafrigoribacterium soli TaxID=3144663 RepID=UPI0032ED06D5
MTEPQAAPAAPGLGRASAILASGTVVSRILGFVKVVVLAAAIGQVASVSADSFAIANQLPNNIYALVAGGVLSAVLVPQIVRAGLHDDGGERFINRVVTLGMVIFALVTLLATLLAPALVTLYAQASSATSGRGFSPDALALATTFAYWCLPQIFFYALYSLLSEVLNARNIFGPFTWAPVLNNVVAIAGLVVFMVLFGDASNNHALVHWDAGRIALLAGTATLGVAAQALVLFFFWRRAGLRYRPDFHWRGVGLSATGKAAGWLFAMVLVTQIAGVFQSKVASIATGHGASNSALANTWLLFMLPHGVIAVSIATAYFTRMSGHANRGDLDSLRKDLSASLRAIGLGMVFAAVVLAVVAYPFARVFEQEFANVAAMGNVLLAFVPGLILFSMLFVIQRVFYALGDTRTPFLMQCVQSGLFIVGALLCSMLPTEWIAVGIAAVTSIAGSAQTVVAIVLVRRRIGGMDGRLVLQRHVQYLVFALVAGVIGLVVLVLLGGLSPDGFAQADRLSAILTIIVISAVMGTVYFGLLLLLRNPELASVANTVRARFSRTR